MEKILLRKSSVIISSAIAVIFVCVAIIIAILMWPQKGTGALLDGNGTLTMADFIYGDEPSLPVTISQTNGNLAAITYKKQTQDDFMYTYAVPNDAGDYTVRAVFLGNDEYKTFTLTKNFTIIKKTIIVAQPIYSEVLSIDDSLPDITTSTQGGTIALDAGQTLRIGTFDYSWTFTPTDTSNYIYSPATGNISLTVALPKGSGTLSMPSWIYSDTTVYNPTATSSTNDNPVFSYKLWNEPDSEYTETLPVNAGQYIARAVFPANDDYRELVLTTSFAIEKKAVYIYGPLSVDLGILRHGDPMPVLPMVDGGYYEWEAGQTLIAGGQNLHWIFIPTDDRNYVYSHTSGFVFVIINMAVDSPIIIENNSEEIKNITYAFVAPAAGKYTITVYDKTGNVTVTGGIQGFPNMPINPSFSWNFSEGGDCQIYITINPGSSATFVITKD